MKKKKISADIKSCQAVICEEKNCPWDRVCANHETAGDFRSEDGTRPILHLEQGDVFCETFYSKGDGVEYHECPTHNSGIGMVLRSELVEETNNFQI